MTTVEKTPRTLEQLVKDFNGSAGQFAAFNAGMDSREKILFKGYLASLRSTEPVTK